MARPRLWVCREPAPDEDLAFFGLNVHGVMRTVWQNVDHADDVGQIWTADDEDGMHWVSDGVERIAVLPPRAFRFFHRGIASRRHYLVNKYLQRLVSRPVAGATVINLGANIGEVAMTMAEYGAHVLAIEPDPNVVPLLCANTRGRSIDVIANAAWNADGPLKLYLNSDHADTSAFNVSEQPITVEARRIDTLVAERGIGRVHLLIGDAEGAEPEVLQGARQTLRSTEYVSLRASAERCGERTLEACEALLMAAGFDILHREETGFCTLIARNRAYMEKAA